MRGALRQDTEEAVEGAVVPLAGRGHLTGRGRGIGANIEHLVDVACAETLDRVSGCIGMQLLEDLRVVEARVCLKNQHDSTSDVRAGHGGAAESRCGCIAPMAGRQDAAARGPDVSACSIIREGRSVISGVRRSDCDR